jgi:S1-C subfamily serine protease
MIVNQVETELVAISQQLRSLTVEIVSYRSGGSGVIWSRDGLIVTNAHVVGSSQINVRFEDNRIVKGVVVARDKRRDLAAIQINVNAQKLPSLMVGNSQLLRPGEMVLAMGSPWVFPGALTAGIVHITKWQAVEETKLYWGDKTFPILDYPASLIVADIRLAPGNSGGILANARGEVIGINMAIFNRLALAIPSQQVENFIQSIP